LGWIGVQRVFHYVTQESRIAFAGPKQRIRQDTL
jgi:hypothetical protein